MSLRDKDDGHALRLEPVLAAIRAVSQAHHEDLVDKSDRGDLYYEPPQDVAYVFSLCVSELFHFGGPRHEFTMLFTNATAAWQHAINIIDARCGSHPPREYAELRDAGRHHEAVEWFSARIMSPSFKLVIACVHGSAPEVR